MLNYTNSYLLQFSKSLLWCNSLHFVLQNKFWEVASLNSVEGEINPREIRSQVNHNVHLWKLNSMSTPSPSPQYPYIQAQTYCIQHDLYITGRLWLCCWVVLHWHLWFQAFIRREGILKKRKKNIQCTKENTLTLFDPKRFPHDSVGKAGSPVILVPIFL